MKPLRPYPNYRQTQFAWIGCVPEHWQTRRLKYLFSEIDNRTDNGEETLLSMRQARGLVAHTEVSDKPITAKELIGYKRTWPGQIVMNRMQASNGMFAVTPENGLVSPDYAVFAPIYEVLPDYYVNLFKAPNFRKKFRVESKGLGTGTAGFLRLYSDRFGAIPAPFPPLDEQKKIVKFVRAYDTCVQDLVRNKQRLIALLNEQKWTIVNHSITRGLNPSAKMQATDTKWAPEVPSHWDVRKIKQVAKFNPSKSEIAAGTPRDLEIVFLPMESVSTSGEINCSQTGTYADLAENYTYFRRGDVVIAKITPCFENGKGAFLGSLKSEFGFGTTEFVVLRPGPEIVPEFLYQITMLPAFRRIGETYMTGSAGQQRVPMSFIKNFSFGLPSIDEQESLLSSIKAETKQFTATIDRARNEIELIQEYRERLIFDVITGKLDVRGIDFAKLKDIGDDQAIEDPNDDIVFADGVLEEADADL